MKCSAAVILIVLLSVMLFSCVGCSANGPPAFASLRIDNFTLSADLYDVRWRTCVFGDIPNREDAEKTVDIGTDYIYLTYNGSQFRTTMTVTTYSGQQTTFTLTERILRYGLSPGSS